MCDLLGVHLLGIYLNSTHIQTSSMNVLAVAMDLVGVWPTRCASTSIVYLNSTQKQTSSITVLAVPMDLVGVWPTRCATTSSLPEFYTNTD